MTNESPENYIHKLRQLVELSRQLSQGGELEPLLQLIVETACELTESQASSIALFEKETGLLKFVAAPRSQIERLRRFRIPLENSLAGKAFRESRTVIIQDTSQEPDLFRTVDYELPFVTQSVVAVPLIYQDSHLGVLEAVNKQDNAHYTEEDVTILETLASFAAVAVNNWMLAIDLHMAYQELADQDQKKADFITNVSRKFRSPLGLILGHAGFLQEAVGFGRYRQQLDILLQNTLRIKDMLDELAVPEADRLRAHMVFRQPLIINEIVKDVAQSFRNAAANKDISLKISVPDEEIIVSGDAEKIAIALGNLLKNAILYTNTGGRVLVQVEKLPGYVKVSVADNGIGIPAGDIPHIFERFYQVKSHANRRLAGLGLGLAVAKIMIELHGGQIWVESTEDKGSTFMFLLPLMTAGAEDTLESTPA